MNKIIHRTDPADPILMGIVNVTPDSFSGDGKLQAGAAIAHGLKLHREGAAILDIGGESTRPGAAPVTIDEEIRRVVPVIEGLRNCGAAISVDTRHAAVMEAALKAGATIINDVSALEGAGSLAVAAKSGAIVCLMHKKGEPQTMQADPRYDDVLNEVHNYLEGRITACTESGVSKDRLLVDVGIGFGKTLEHNLTLLKNIDHFASLGVPILLGVSRKRFIEALSPGVGADQRVPGSIAAVLAAYTKGVRYFRVHDVAETVQALTVFRATR